VGKGIFRDHPFGLVDVGVSGGMDACWEVFGGDLRAVGFDGLVKEVERLNATAGNSNRQYYSFLVGDKTYRAPQGVPNSEPFPRTSAARAIEIADSNGRSHSAGSNPVATEVIELSDFFMRAHPMDVDFIKVDTDGSDFQVLRGAKELISSAPVLGLAVECQFHGLVHDESNTFRNIDRLVTALGFSLFDLEVYRYSRATLPKPFVYRLPAQTSGGQVLWGDALYLRDAGNIDYERDWSMALAREKILKLACLFEVFGMEDCAAELLLKYRSNLQELVDVDVCLDLLTPRARFRKISYRDYRKRFEQNPASFYPAR